MKKLFFIFILTFFLSILIVNLTHEDEKVIKYFPLDETKNFIDQETMLTLLKPTDDDSYQLSWSIKSKTNEPIDLRQDLSLLFIDGKLKGILNQWKENVSALEQITIFNGEGSSNLEAISFHHGEVHYPEEVIKSIQSMTHDELYIMDSPHTPLESFKEPVTNNEIEWKRTLDHAKFQQLTYYWKRLMDHYQLNSEDYVQIPLTQLHYYENEPFPTLTLEQTQQVLGQLWEGLYRHYIVGISYEKTEDGNPLNTYMPLILVDKKGEHIYVLYEDTQGNKQRLIQEIPTF
ncbi:hypothetical protein [Salirhabdus sp. Marseille-P4669]|uniref:hypothetical protein n=1 Tax=Salirhabdus sp. Marseille-P4669 TaxID=2042310 RepID=UPI000C7AD36B|nr:hypothetical protein [Salirhabdus sp. Marseille-P4669]